MRRYRPVLFILSVLIALALHALLFYLAPQIVLFSKPAAIAKEVKPLRLSLRPAGAAPSTAPSSRVLATRPSTVSDLVQRDDEEAQPESSLTDPFQPLDNLANRVAADPIAREHDLAPNMDVLNRADARILEIAANDARTQLDVTRRLVRPSSNRLLEPGELPTLRSEGADGPVPMEIASLGRSILNEPSAPPAVDERIRGEGISESAPAPEPIAPVLRIENIPMTQAAEEVRKESAFTFLDDMLDVRLDIHVPDPAQPGYFRLRVLPREGTTLPPLRKEVTFVVDASQSIPQHKLRATTKGLAAGLNMLRPEDNFNIVVFRNTNQPLRPAPENATDALKQEAVAFLNGLEAKGETDVYQALLPLVQTAPPAGYPSLIVLLSDGRPTIGMKDTRTLINSLTADNRLQNTMYAYAAGKNVNRGLLDLLAYRNKGRSRVVDNVDGIEKDLPAFLAQLKDPLLVDCRADFAQVDPAQVYPKNLADLYAAQPLIIYGRYDVKAQERFLVRITGRAGETPKEVVFETAFKDAQSEDASVAKGWAFEKAYFLIGELSRNGETPEAMAELRALSERYGIKTSYD